ncbi:MAG: cytochrome c biogenesis protein CcdA [Bacteroidota bacterium]
MKVRLLLFALAAVAQLSAQNPVKWSFSSTDLGNNQYDLIFTGTIDEGWSTYSQFLESDAGPVPTTFTYKEGAHFKLVGKAKESGGKISLYDKVFEMNVSKFKHSAIFTQRVEVKDKSKAIEGYLNFMTCNDEMCLPPKDVDFKFDLSKAAGAGKPAVAPTNGSNSGKEGATPTAPADQHSGKNTPGVGLSDAPGATVPATETPVVNAPPTASGNAAAAIAPPNDPSFKGFWDSKRAEINSKKFVNSCGAVEASTSYIGVFIGGFLGGLLALLTPCVFPMIPMTVSFFVKRSKDRKTGLRNAIWYSLSIILIYVGLGVALTAALGPNVLNEMSTDMYFNLLFFTVFVIFALSFFGLFEITLPSSWVNASDKMADRGGSLGIFFMAFTLALVSFSCTGPIVGTLLVEAARSNEGAALFGLIPLKPTIGMFSFGLALALPFGLFAMFPGWLNSLPKSGGWMDNVKVTLGLVELALAFKFLSTADLVRHWGILKFETFLGIWVLLSFVLGLYQLGILNWKGAKGRPGLLRAGVGIAALVFSGYLGWGLVNYQSLSLLSGLAPPVHYNIWGPHSAKKGTGCPHNLDCYHDFDEGLAEAKRQNKPLFVDFTGYGCVNCRKMEENVWDKPGVIENLRNNYVVVSLYVDDKERLFPEDKFHYLLDPNTGEKMRTVGDKWGTFEKNNFGQASQPWYVLMHNDGTTVLNQPRGFTPDVSEYKSFLDCGYDAFKKVSQQQPGGMIGQTLGGKKSDVESR